MRRSLAATLVALSLALTLAPAVVSAADEGKARATVPLASLARTAATTDSERASAALARAKALFGGPKSGDLATAPTGTSPASTPTPPW